jgi:hypothetical protein
MHHSGRRHMGFCLFHDDPSHHATSDGGKGACPGSPKWYERRVLSDRKFLASAHPALLTTAMEVYHAAVLGDPKVQDKREHVEFLQDFRCVYPVPHPDNVGCEM